MTQIAVDQSKWDDVSSEERAKIEAGLRQAGILKADDSLVPRPMPAAAGWDPIKDICKAACDVAAGTAIAWCTANTAGAATALCIAVAGAARDECRNRC